MKYTLIIEGTKDEIESVKRTTLSLYNNGTWVGIIDINLKVVETKYRFKTLSELAVEFGSKLTVHPTVSGAIAIKTGDVFMLGAELAELGKPADRLTLTNYDDWKRIFLKEVE